MCGFVGIWQREQAIDRQILERMRDSLAHRGPDDSGAWYSQRAHLALGFRRLSIIDLSMAGHQPMVSEDGRYTLVFNGEVYNFAEIRSELEEKGFHFRSQCDTEVILNAWHAFGPDCLERFRGMFCFAVWDEHERSLFIARDRFGIKPLYYYFDGQRFIFASELKAIVTHPEVPRKINHDALDDYLTYGYVPFDRAIFQNTAKLPAGHFLRFREGQIETRRYWELTWQPRDRPESVWVDELRAGLEEAVRLWKISDVPVGVFLSGGLDSSSVCTLMSRLHPGKVGTYAIGFDYERRNELPYAARVAKECGTDHHERIVSVTNTEALLPELAQVYDEPFYDTSMVPTLYVSEFAGRDLRVVLSGDGGDELFFGYGWYQEFLRLAGDRSMSTSLLRQVYPMVPRFVRGLPYAARVLALEVRTTTDPMQRYFRQLGFLDDYEKQRILPDLKVDDKDPLWLFRRFYRPDLPPETALRLLDVNTYLVDDILTKVDRATMAFSLEARPPLLEHKLAELIFTLPNDVIYRDRVLKYTFKKVLAGLLPDDIIHRKKRGFSAPVRNWLMGDLWKIVESRLLTGYAVADGLLQAGAIRAMVRNITPNRWAKLWMLMVFEEWYRRWMHNIMPETRVLLRKADRN